MSTLILEPITSTAKAIAEHLGYASDARCRALVLTTEPHRTMVEREQTRHESAAHELLMVGLATLRKLP
jgi:hypothetical protein